MSHRRWCAVALLLAVGTTGCSAKAASLPPHRTPTATVASVTPSPTPLLAPTAPADTALGAGERIWAAFSERGLSYDQWWAHLKPLLSDAAQAVYVYDDPRNIPAMTLTGPLRVAAKPPAEPHFTAEVIVPTSRGAFRLDLERRARTKTSPWLLYAIRFPAGVQ